MLIHREESFRRDVGTQWKWWFAARVPRAQKAEWVGPCRDFEKGSRVL